MLSINSSMLSQSLNGLNNATQKVSNASKNLAEFPLSQNELISQNSSEQLNIEDKISISTSNMDPVKDIISLMEGEIAYKANAKGIKTADEMLGSVLDIKV
ncbi:hypothetical protein JXR93_00930 [bacterium]|nr:hypothetical protein [bacterium]